MDKELRKRVEEAAEKYARRVVPMTLSAYEEYIKEAKADFHNGAEYGYKEAIALAKEWMRNYLPDELDGKGFEFVSRDEILADFEADMNKLWEGEK